MTALVSSCRRSAACDAVHVTYRNGSIKAYMDDSPIMEYVRTTMDAKCELRLVRSGFSEDAYSIALPKNSNLKVGDRHLHSPNIAR